jgi:hypothetical protein
MIGTDSPRFTMDSNAVLVATITDRRSAQSSGTVFDRDIEDRHDFRELRSLMQSNTSRNF